MVNPQRELAKEQRPNQLEIFYNNMNLAGGSYPYNLESE